MSSEGSQRGSSMGDMTSNMSSYDYSSSRSGVIPSIHDAAQGLAHLAMLASRERAPPYAGQAAESSMSRGQGHARGGHAPFQHGGHPDSFHRGTARAAAGRGSSVDEFGESGTTPSMFWYGSNS